MLAKDALKLYEGKAKHFDADGVGEGDEVEIGQNVYVTRPDNFNQLRRLLGRLVEPLPLAA